MNLKSTFRRLPLVSVFIVLTFGLLVLESLKYPGFIGNHFLIDAKVYFAATIILLLFLKNESKIDKLILKANQIILIPLSLVYLGFSLLEGAKYTNYVLSTFHLHLDGMITLVLFSLFVFLTDKFKNEIPQIRGKLKIIFVVMVSVLVLFVVKNSVYVANMAIGTSSYILFHFRDTYDQKMFYEWGENYNFLMFVKENTPENATIVIPPMEAPWDMGTGNDHFVRAFLFPRKIVPETKIIKDIKAYPKGTYILISWGKEACQPEGCHGWPRQDIFAQKIIYKDPNSFNAVEIKVNSIYKLEDQKYVWGLIEL